ncbi:MAG: TnpV protein [Lachnospiraceae bacterium]|nr:TnpV protein [Ruminococcus sp.]MCM1277052.1 TnpV protein [Lachnospiraceae bacterium]
MEKINQIWCEEDGVFYPETKTENGRTYKLDPKTFVYPEQMELGLTDEEQELMNEDIGQYGEKWRQFMRENHPEVIPSLEGRLKWELIPRQVDKEAWEYRELLRKQYAAKHPRPTEFGELVKWENTLGMMIDCAIMEDVVLVYRE